MNKVGIKPHPIGRGRASACTSMAFSRPPVYSPNIVFPGGEGIVVANCPDDMTGGSSSCQPWSAFGELTRSTAASERRGLDDAREFLLWGDGELPTSHLRSYRSERQRADNNTCIQRFRKDVSLPGVVPFGSEPSASAAAITVTVWGLGSAQITLPPPICEKPKSGYHSLHRFRRPAYALAEWRLVSARYVFSLRPTAYHVLSADDRFAHRFNRTRSLRSDGELGTRTDGGKGADVDHWR